MDLPTYTNIWRIEKRLYKLYDFRLPMPLPVGQIAVFTAIAVPYVVILKALGVPFSHTLLWLYILPPGALAWVVTRPVLESKRLPELVVSQLRYLSEPRTWCRMAPLAEKDEIVITARVWRRVGAELREAGQQAGAAVTAVDVVPVVTAVDVVPVVTAVDVVPLVTTVDAMPLVTAADTMPAVTAAPAPGTPARPWRATRVQRRSTAPPVPARPEAPAPRPAARAAPSWPDRPARGVRVPPVPDVRAPDPAGAAVAVPGAAEVGGPGRAGRAVPGAAGVGGPGRAGRAVPGTAEVGAPGPAEPAAQAVPAQAPAGQAASAPERAVSAAAPTPTRPRAMVTVTGDQDAERPLRVVERALGSPSQRRGSGWHDHVVVVPGGHRPGRPDQSQRDRARARLPLPGGHRIVVLGCTVGAGQTMTTLLTGEMLATLRDGPVAVLDLNPGEGSLAERARAVPAWSGSQPPAPSRAEVITHEAAGPGEDVQEITSVFELLSARYPLTLADPGAAAVPRVLVAAEQLVLVAPASKDAASALTTTREWLEAHGHAGLADSAIIVLNGVSRHTLPHVEQAEALARGRCRAILRVPWDDRLKNPGPERLPRSPAGSLSPAAVNAYTALSGVLIAALGAAFEQEAGSEQLQRVRP